VKTSTLPRKVRRLTNWRETAVEMYVRFYGNRCVKCSRPVKVEDAALWSMDGLYDLILTHRKCQR
jgi:hypothetical protein